MKLHNADHLDRLIGGGADNIREFPYREKIAMDLDFLPGVSFAAHREFPHCKKIAADGKLVANFLQCVTQKFRDGEFLWEFWNYERQINLIITATSVYSSHLAMKKVNLGIHSLGSRFVVEFNSHIGQIVFDIGIHEEKPTIFLYISLQTGHTTFVRLKYAEAGGVGNGKSVQYDHRDRSCRSTGGAEHIPAHGAEGAA